jgi:uroporphyrinogen-III synthase
MSDTPGEPVPPSPPETPPRKAGLPLLWLSVGFLAVVIVAAATTPFWAPAVMQQLPWGTPTPAAAPPKPPAPDAGLTARIAALETARAQEAQIAAALQQLTQRVAALEAKPPPDLSAIQQQLVALNKTIAGLSADVATLDRAEQARPAGDPGNAALVLVLLQIHAAVEVARPFAAEYATLLALAKDHPDIAAAAAPLAEPSATGVASLAALARRLHQLAPQIAAAAPPGDGGWWSRTLGRVRSLVTIRRIDGAGQSPSEAAVSTAETALAGGDLGGSIAALDGLTGANRAVAEAWLKTARQRLAVETTLRQLQTLATALLGAAPAPGRPG